MPATESSPTSCPCGSGRQRSACCGPLLDGATAPATCEALMRSRYSAFVEGNVAYLGATLHPDHRDDYDEAATRQWAEKSTWLGLDIVGVKEGGEGDEQGAVEFVARYAVQGKPFTHHEIATFTRHDGRWHYVEGLSPKVETVVHEGPRIGRNDPCPCGSGKKFKKCCAET